MTDIRTILEERGADYGPYIGQASNSVAMKNIIHTAPEWPRGASDQQEALDMITVKIARLVTGNINHLDSWRDIAGYATLVADRLEKDSA